MSIYPSELLQEGLKQDTGLTLMQVLQWSWKKKFLELFNQNFKFTFVFPSSYWFWKDFFFVYILKQNDLYDYFSRYLIPLYYNRFPIYLNGHLVSSLESLSM